MSTTVFQVWYMRPDFRRDGGMGADWLRERDQMPSPAALERTHVHLKDVELPSGKEPRDAELERIWVKMQGEEWSPNGEARPLIRAKGLHHTSMSVGDVVVVEGETFLVDSCGFARIECA